MTLELRVTVDDDVREYSFARREVSIGSAPFNDIVLPADDAGCLGTLRTLGEGQGGAEFVCKASGRSARLVRSGELLEEHVGADEVTWTIEPG